MPSPRTDRFLHPEAPNPLASDLFCLIFRAHVQSRLLHGAGPDCTTQAHWSFTAREVVSEQKAVGGPALCWGSSRPRQTSRVSKLPLPKRDDEHQSQAFPGKGLSPPTCRWRIGVRECATGDPKGAIHRQDTQSNKASHGRASVNPTGTEDGSCARRLEWATQKPGPEECQSRQKRVPSSFCRPT